MQYHWRRKVNDFSLLFGGPLYSRIRVVQKNPNQARFMTRFTLGSMWVPVLSFVTELWPSLRVSFYVSSILVRCLCKYWRNISTTRQVKYDETEWSETCCLHEHCQHPLLYSCLHLPLSYLSFLYIYFFYLPIYFSTYSLLHRISSGNGLLCPILFSAPRPNLYHLCSGFLPHSPSLESCTKFITCVSYTCGQSEQHR